MRFLITMNMPARSGGSVHQIIAEYPAESLEEFLRVLESRDFVVIEEFYKDADAGGRLGASYYSVGFTAINHRYVGKIKVISGDMPHQRRRD